MCAQRRHSTAVSYQVGGAVTGRSRAAGVDPDEGAVTVGEVGEDVPVVVRNVGPGAAVLAVGAGAAKVRAGETGLVESLAVPLGEVAGECDGTVVVLGDESLSGV